MTLTIYNYQVADNGGWLRQWLISSSGSTPLCLPVVAMANWRVEVVGWNNGMSIVSVEMTAWEAEKGQD
jgi:hypothetical protein